MLRTALGAATRGLELWRPGSLAGEESVLRRWDWASIADLEVGIVTAGLATKPALFIVGTDGSRFPVFVRSESRARTSAETCYQAVRDLQATPGWIASRSSL